MKLALAVAAATIAAAGWGCKSAEKDHQEAPAAPARDAAAAARDASATAATPDPAADLEKLAEMPELTAEATEAEIERRLERALDSFSAFLEVVGEHTDCGAMGRSLGRFAEVNQRFFQNLQELNRPELSKRLEERIRSRGVEWMNRLAKNLQRCVQHPEVMAALMKLSQQQ